MMLGLLQWRRGWCVGACDVVPAAAQCCCCCCCYRHRGGEHVCNPCLDWRCSDYCMAPFLMNTASEFTGTQLGTIVPATPESRPCITPTAATAAVARCLPAYEECTRCFRKRCRLTQPQRDGLLSGDTIPACAVTA